MPAAIPRLASIYVEPILEGTIGKQPADLSEMTAVHHEFQTFPTASGDRASEADLHQIRESLLEVASQHGFPDGKLGRTAGVDRDLAIKLHEELPVTVHAAASDEMWVFLTCVLLLDVAVWRFPKRTPERFHGGVERNVFRRLWMRREILGPPKGENDPLWSLEDPLVQIMERTGVSENKSLSRSIADAYREHWGDRPGSEREHLMRNFMLRVTRRQGLARLECLSEEKRTEALAEAVDQTTNAFEARSPTSLPHRDSSSPPSASSVEDVPLRQLVETTFEVLDGIKVGFSGRDLDSRMLAKGLRMEKRHEKTVEQVFKQFRDEGQLIQAESPEGNLEWVGEVDAPGKLAPEVAMSIGDIRRRAKALGFTQKEDRATLVQELGVEEPLPKYLKRVINSAISNASSGGD